MKISFDGQLFLGECKTGVAWNAHHLILELAKYPGNECILQVFSMRRRKHKEKLQKLEEYRKAGCSVVCCRWFHYSLYKLLWMLVPVPYRIFFKTRPDITQFFNFTAPPGAGGKCLVFVHDMAYRSCPETVRSKTRRWLELGMEKSCRHADQVITVSEFSKKEIMKYLHVPPERVSVVPNAVDHAVYHTGYTDAQVEKVLEKYQIGSKYFLYLGTIEPRKNLERLIGAYMKLCNMMAARGSKDTPQLVLSGSRGWLCDGIYEKADALRREHKIIFTGYVAQEDSPLLMRGAAAFIFPSLYEGFGIPPLEAMACGTPVIVSNAASLPEVVGEAGLLVDPRNEDEICGAMIRLLQDEAYRKRLGRLGEKRAAAYTWERSAELLMGVYRGLQDGNDTARQEGLQ